LFSCTMVYFWLMNIHIRTTRVLRQRIAKGEVS
jgi:hypothetical protein